MHGAAELYIECFAVFLATEVGNVSNSAEKLKMLDHFVVRPNHHLLER